MATESSRFFRLALMGAPLLFWAGIYLETSMGRQKRPENQQLEQMHRKLFKEQTEYLRADFDSLEQPFAGEVVDAVTTYSPYGEPIVEK